MKKVFLSLVILAFSPISYAQTTYECYRYVNGSPTGTWVKVKAESKSEAESIAYEKMKGNGSRVDYAKCKIPLF